MKLTYAFPSYLHQQVEEANRQVSNWILQKKLLDPQQLQQYRNAKITWFSARLYPFCPLDRLVLIAKLFCVLFLLDDFTDAVSDKINFWKKLGRDFKNVLDDRKLISGSELISCFSEIWKELSSLGGAEWTAYTKPIFVAFLDGGIWEAGVRQRGRIPTVKDYMYYRTDFSGVRIAFLLLPLLNRTIKLDIYRQAEFLQLIYHAGRIIFLANDLISYPKEVQARDWNNMVRLIQREEGLSIFAAFDHVFDLHYREVAIFHLLEKELCGCDNPEMNALGAALRHMIAGSAAWSSKDTDRYMLGEK